MAALNISSSPILFFFLNTASLAWNIYTVRVLHCLVLRYTLNTYYKYIYLSYSCFPTLFFKSIRCVAHIGYLHSACLASSGSSLHCQHLL
ncbi:uncharacterized protein LOC117162308 isoform X4 [Bombus vancouverensis nearcticus]|uniref:uncharacterized protein LOC143302419 isoform X4 n=1 Tax=Bombus vancouverensis nearcticus TaxID=2705178 RepID=UPI00402B0D75